MRGVPHENMVGAEGAGWTVARGTLAHERSFATQRSVHFAPGATGRVIDEARLEATEYLKTYEWYPQRMGRVDLVAERAGAMGLAEDPVLRQAISDLLSLQRASEWTAGRAKAGRELGRPPGSEGSIGKLALSEVARRAHRVHTRIAGARGLLKESDDPVDAVIAEVLVSTPAQSIAGGTDEIQHNIIGENVLGLPREPAVDRGTSFRDAGKEMRRQDPS